METEPNFLPPNDKLSNLLVSVGDNNCKKFAQNNLIISAAWQKKTKRNLYKKVARARTNLE